MFERLRGAMLKPAEPGSSRTISDEWDSLEQLQALHKSANDKERLVGLIAAPLAAAIGILVMGALISDDPPAHLANGTLNKLHVNVLIYHELTIVLIGLSVVMLVVAWFRKRLYLGMVMALYGLAIFNLHYWGFGIPFVMAGAWLLVRAFRLQRALREATGDAPWQSGALGRGASTGARPRSNKRYTPPSSGRSRAPRANPADDVG